VKCLGIFTLLLLSTLAFSSGVQTPKPEVDGHFSPSKTAATDGLSEEQQAQVQQIRLKAAEITSVLEGSEAPKTDQESARKKAPELIEEIRKLKDLLEKAGKKEVARELESEAVKLEQLLEEDPPKPVPIGAATAKETLTPSAAQSPAQATAPVKEATAQPPKTSGPKKKETKESKQAKPNRELEVTDLMNQLVPPSHQIPEKLEDLILQSNPDSPKYREGVRAALTELSATLNDPKQPPKVAEKAALDYLSIRLPDSIEAALENGASREAIQKALSGTPLEVARRITKTLDGESEKTIEKLESFTEQEVNPLFRSSFSALDDRFQAALESLVTNPTLSKNPDLIAALAGLGHREEGALKEGILTFLANQDPNAAAHLLESGSARSVLLDALRAPDGDGKDALQKVLSGISDTQLKEESTQAALNEVILQRMAELVSNGSDPSKDRGLQILAEKLGRNSKEMRALEKDVSKTLRQFPEIRRALEAEPTQYTEAERKNLEKLTAEILKLQDAERRVSQSLQKSQEHAIQAEGAFVELHKTLVDDFKKTEAQLKKATAELEESRKKRGLLKYVVSYGEEEKKLETNISGLQEKLGLLSEKLDTLQRERFTKKGGKAFYESEIPGVQYVSDEVLAKYRKPFGPGTYDLRTGAVSASKPDLVGEPKRVLDNLIAARADTARYSLDLKEVGGQIKTSQEKLAKDPGVQRVEAAEKKRMEEVAKQFGVSSPETLQGLARLGDVNFERVKALAVTVNAPGTSLSPERRELYGQMFAEDIRGSVTALAPFVGSGTAGFDKAAQFFSGFNKEARALTEKADQIALETKAEFERKGWGSFDGVGLFRLGDRAPDLSNPEFREALTNYGKAVTHGRDFYRELMGTIQQAQNRGERYIQLGPNYVMELETGFGARPGASKKVDADKIRIQAQDAYSAVESSWSERGILVKNPGADREQAVQKVAENQRAVDRQISLLREFGNVQFGSNGGTYEAGSLARVLAREDLKSQEFGSQIIGNAALQESYKDQVSLGKSLAAVVIGLTLVSGGTAAPLIPYFASILQAGSIGYLGNTAGADLAYLVDKHVFSGNPVYDYRVVSDTSKSAALVAAITAGVAPGFQRLVPGALGYAPGLRNLSPTTLQTLSTVSQKVLTAGTSAGAMTLLSPDEQSAKTNFARALANSAFPVKLVGASGTVNLFGATLRGFLLNEVQDVAVAGSFAIGLNNGQYMLGNGESVNLKSGNIRDWVLFLTDVAPTNVAHAARSAPGVIADRKNQRKLDEFSKKGAGSLSSTETAEAAQILRALPADKLVEYIKGGSALAEVARAVLPTRPSWELSRVKLDPEPEPEANKIPAQQARAPTAAEGAPAPAKTQSHNSPEDVIKELQAERTDQGYALKDSDITRLQEALTRPDGGDPTLSRSLRTQAQDLIKRHINNSLRRNKQEGIDGVPRALREVAQDFGLGKYLEATRKSLGIKGSPPPNDGSPEFKFPEKPLTVAELEVKAAELEAVIAKSKDRALKEGFQRELESLRAAIDYQKANPEKALYRVTDANGPMVRFPTGAEGQVDKALVISRPQGSVEVIVEEKGGAWKLPKDPDGYLSRQPGTESDDRQRRQILERSQAAKYTSTGKKTIAVLKGDEPPTSGLKVLEQVFGSADNARGLVYLMPRSEYQKFLATGEMSDSFARFLDSDPKNRNPETLPKLFQEEQRPARFSEVQSSGTRSALTGLFRLRGEALPPEAEAEFAALFKKAQERGWTPMQVMEAMGKPFEKYGLGSVFAGDSDSPVRSLARQLAGFGTLKGAAEVEAIASIRSGNTQDPAQMGRLISSFLSQNGVIATIRPNGDSTARSSGSFTIMPGSKGKSAAFGSTESLGKTLSEMLGLDIRDYEKSRPSVARAPAEPLSWIKSELRELTYVSGMQVSEVNGERTIRIKAADLDQDTPGFKLMPKELRDKLTTPDPEGFINFTPRLIQEVESWMNQAVSQRVANVLGASESSQLRHLALWNADKNGSNGSSALVQLFRGNVAFLGPGHGSPGGETHSLLPITVKGEPLFVTRINADELWKAFAQLPGVKNSEVIYYRTCSGGLCGTEDVVSNAQRGAQITGKPVIAPMGIAAHGYSGKGNQRSARPGIWEKSLPPSVGQDGRLKGGVEGLIPPGEAYRIFYPDGTSKAIDFDTVVARYVQPDKQRRIEYARDPKARERFESESVPAREPSALDQARNLALSRLDTASPSRDRFRQYPDLPKLPEVVEEVARTRGISADKISETEIGTIARVERLINEVREARPNLSYEQAREIVFLNSRLVSVENRQNQLTPRSGGKAESLDPVVSSVLREVGEGFFGLPYEKRLVEAEKALKRLYQIDSTTPHRELAADGTFREAGPLLPKLVEALANIHPIDLGDQPLYRSVSPKAEGTDLKDPNSVLAFVRKNFERQIDEKTGRGYVHAGTDRTSVEDFAKGVRVSEGRVPIVFELPQGSGARGFPVNGEGPIKRSGVVAHKTNAVVPNDLGITNLENFEVDAKSVRVKDGVVYARLQPKSTPEAQSTGARIPLDQAGALGLRAEVDPVKGTTTFRLDVDSLGGEKALATLREGLTLTVDGKPVSVDTAVKLTGSQSQIEVGFFGQPVSRVLYNSEKRILEDTGAHRQLSSFELRRFDQEGKAYVEEWKQGSQILSEKASYTPVTDLHTHFAGSIRSETLVARGLEKAIPYPTKLLDRLGIQYDSSKAIKRGSDTFIPLTRENLSAEGLRTLTRALSIAPLQVRGFIPMEHIYEYRSPLVKDRDSFAHFLKEAALDYKKAGVRYVETSISDVTKPDWLAEAHRALPEIEKETGVKIRFVAGLWRHSDRAWNMDQIARIKALDSPYIVGVDFMGHETNSTRAFEDQIRSAATIRETHPQFQIRVHAGENPLYPENVRVAIEAGATRIGHGLYGVDDATLGLAVKNGVVIEFNQNSNMALNNISSPREIPIKRYLDAGARVTLSTDGHAIYHTSARAEADAARLAGLSNADLLRVAASDRRHIASMESMFQSRMARANSLQVDPSRIPAPTYTAEYEKASNERRAQRQKALRVSLSEDRERGGIRGKIALHDEDAVAEQFKGMTPILFSGASEKSWPLISSDNQAKVRRSVEAYLSVLDPKTAYLVTGATNFGVEKIVHEVGRKMGFRILGTLVEDAKPTEIGPITDGVVMGNSWYDKSAKALGYVQQNGGRVVFVGGGNILKDEIQAAKNAGVRFDLMSGPEGASTDAAKLFGANAFRGASDLLERTLSDTPRVAAPDLVSSRTLGQLSFEPVTKQAIQYQFGGEIRDPQQLRALRPLSYATNTVEGLKVETRTSDGKETEAVAKKGDVVMTGPNGEQYIVKPEKFKKLYEGNVGGTVVPEQSPRQVARYSGPNGRIMASFDEVMVLKNGDYVVQSEPGKFYRIGQDEFHKTYNPLSKTGTPSPRPPPPQKSGEAPTSSVSPVNLTKAVSLAPRGLSSQQAQRVVEAQKQVLQEAHEVPRDPEKQFAWWRKKYEPTTKALTEEIKKSTGRSHQEAKAIASQWVRTLMDEAVLGEGAVPKAVSRRGAEPPFRGSKEEWEAIDKLLKAPLPASSKTGELLELASQKLSPSQSKAFSKWLLGQFAEDGIGNFEDHFLGRQRTEFPEGPTRFNKEGERPFDGYLAAREYLAGRSLEDIHLDQLRETHRKFMSRESIQGDKGRVFQTDGRPARNSQGLADSELGAIRNENVGFDIDGKHLPQGVAAVGRTLTNLLVENPYLRNNRVGFVSYAPLSSWIHLDGQKPLPDPLVKRIRALEQNVGTMGLDKATDPETKAVYKEYLTELSSRVWEEAKTGVKKADTPEEVLAAAAKFQREFASIHPFFDGNGRMVRLLTEKLLESKGLPAPLYAHWGEDLALSRVESERQLAQGVALSQKFQSDLEKSIRSGQGYENVPNPILAIRAKEILGDPTGHFDSPGFVKWAADHREEYASFPEAVKAFAQTNKTGSANEKFSPEQLERAKTIMASKAPFFNEGEFVLWRREHSKPGRAFEEEVRDYANWLEDLVYEDKSGAIRLASPAFQRSFGKLSGTQQEYDRKMSSYYSSEEVYRGVPSDKYLSDLEMARLFVDPTGFITGNGVNSRVGSETILPALQQFNAGLLRDAGHLRKQVIDHKNGLDDNYHMSGMVSFSEERRVADHWKVSYSDIRDLSVVFTAKKREVAVVNTAKRTRKLGQEGMANEREEALIGGADPESIMRVELTQEHPDPENGLPRVNKTATRINFNTIEISETLYPAGKPPQVTKSQWRISPSGGTALLLRMQ